ncbi:MAG: putative fluoride ion transporter CrcB [Phycisphaerae bacterium]|nr:putative fluoride ion transporter CrcB [Phycisphaerae bacterium]
MLQKLLLVAVGSGAGGVLRYLLSGLVQRYTSDQFPWGTFVVNVLGCLLFGLLVGGFSGTFLNREGYRLLLLVGVLGGFTTFSTFGYETFALFNDRQFHLALWNIIMGNGVGLMALGLGYRLMEKWSGG